MNRLLLGIEDKTNLQLELLECDFHNGVTIIDPIGDLARKAANRLPPHLVKHAVYFEPTATRAVGINLLDNVPALQHQLLTELFCTLIDGLFPEGSNTLTRVNASHVLANCIRLLLCQKHETLLGILKLLSDQDFLRKCIKECDDPIVKRNWAQIHQKAKQYESAFAFIETKIGGLLMSPTIRHVVAQKTTLKPTDTILIANLDRTRLGDSTARFLGALIIARSTGTLYVNDFGFFAGRDESYASLLSQERTTASLDYLDELPALRQRLLGIKIKYTLRTTNRDAEDLAPHMGLLNPSILLGLRPHEVRSSAGETLFPTLPRTSKRLRAVKRRTRARRTRPTTHIQRQIQNYLDTTVD